MLLYHFFVFGDLIYFGCTAELQFLVGIWFLLIFVIPGEVTCEPPNNRLDKFQGKLEIGDEKCSLDNSNIVLRVRCRNLII